MTLRRMWEVRARVISIEEALIKSGLLTKEDIDREYNMQIDVIMDRTCKKKEEEQKQLPWWKRL